MIPIEIVVWRDVLAKQMRTQWNRDLPFGELISDRWARAKRLGFGKNASIYDSSCVYGTVLVGKNTWIGPNTILDGSGGILQIGKFCSISAGVQIYTHNSVAWATSMGKKPYKKAKTIIGDGVYIGPNTVVSCGVKIGNRAVIGCNSFVNRNVLSGCRVLGKV